MPRRLLALALLVLLTGCVTMLPPDRSLLRQIRWDSRVLPAGDFYRGELYVEINGTSHLLLPDAVAQYQELTRKEYASYGVPAKAVSAAMSFHAGYGDIIYAVVVKDRVEIFREEMDEAESSRYPVKRILVVPLERP